VSTPERPVLRIVRPDEAQPKEQTPTEAPRAHAAVPQPQPSQGLVTLSKTVDGLDLQVPRSSALLVNAGSHLVNQALAFHHQAIAHAPAGTFRNDISPGLKSTEATKAWMRSHFDTIKKTARELERVTTPYVRRDDLQQAVKLAGAELDRATAVAGVGGLLFGDRAAAAFKDVVAFLTQPAATATVTITATSTVIPSEGYGDYILGTDVLSAG
jgi:hypothetical protein